MNRNVSVVNDFRSPAAEAFRSLRTNIEFSNAGKKIRSIVITSSVPSEGKSTIAFNLGLSLAQTGKKVLLVDADLRKPTIYSYTDSKSIIGLTNIIVQGMHYESALKTYDGMENLGIITSGPIPPNPCEILGSEKMKSLLGALEQEYEMIILDSPPIGMFTDAVVLSTMVDGVIMVCVSGKTKTDDLNKAIKSLNKVNAKIIGIVVNKIKYRKSATYSSYYYKNK